MLKNCAMNVLLLEVFHITGHWLLNSGLYEVLLILDKEKHPVDGSNLLLCVQYSPLLLTFSSWILILRAKMNMKIDQTMKYNRGFICWRCSFPEMERDEKKQFLPIKGLLKLKAVYMYAAGFYTYSIFALIFWETRRSDFGVSMSHHVATVILIVLSYILRFGRVGSVVLAIHDASDVFLEVGKMSKYSGAEGVASFAFILFVLSWILLRLIYYPFWVLWSTRLNCAMNVLLLEVFHITGHWLLNSGLYEVLLILDKEKHPVDGPIYYYVFNTLLYCLLFLHVYWWVLIYQMLAKQIQARGHLSDDVRSGMEEKQVDCMVLFYNILRAKMNMKIDQTMKYNRGFICWRCSFPEMERDEKKQFLPIKGLYRFEIRCQSRREI
ncbi:hypothetical protein NC653_021000 [Populus alba x Populus x berolinensis]|uniref:TLC domain-containing protein n=1 Tax=Populus alba x Populus x berolinensis TaxID=444605 RepID=A0AAD6MM34_9ROSI|nr:hypothetical protein NC653_021000 [Populus alba x Populus x berolinensis]